MHVCLVNGLVPAISECECVFSCALIYFGNCSCEFVYKLKCVATLTQYWHLALCHDEETLS